MNFRLPLLVVWLSLISAGVQSANAQGAPAEKPVIVSAKLHFLSVGAAIDKLEVIGEKGKRLPVAIPNSFLSSTIEYQGPFVVTIARPNASVASAIPAAPSNGAAAASPAKPVALNVAAQVTLPPEGGEFLLLFAPGEEDRYRVVALPFSPTSVPAGNYLVFNISQHRIAFTFGAAKLIIASGQRELVSPHAADDSYVPLRVYDEYKGEPRLIVSGRHFNRANARQIFLFFNSDNPSAPVRMQAITDVLPIPGAASAASAQGPASRNPAGRS